MVDVVTHVQFLQGGAVVRDTSEDQGSPWADAKVWTVETSDWRETVQQLYRFVADLVQALGARANDLINAIYADPQRVLNTLVTGFQQALTQFTDELPTTLKESLYQWLLGGPNGAALVNLFQNANWGDAATATSFLLQYAGLTWDHVYAVLHSSWGRATWRACRRWRPG
jgi:hypothetical protein